MAEQIVFNCFLIFLAWRGYGVIAYAWAIATRSLIGTIIMLIIKPWSIGLKINLDSLKHLLGFGVKFQLNDFLARVKDQLYYLVLGQLLPLNQFGFV
mgnify:FL=1